MPTLSTDLPLQDAIDQIARREVVPSGMTSAEWQRLQAEIRMRAFFSAKVEDERILAEMKERLQARIELAKRDGRTMDRGVFIEEMRELVRKSGWKRGDDIKRGSLQDLKSTRRLGLIFDMNLAQAQGFARWKSDMTPEGLDNEPAYELIRVMNRLEIRDWPRIWRDAGGRFFDGEGSNDDYPLAPGRMIALKTDPIWTRISRFGTPWPPFDWGSGMGLRGIDRDETDAFGITGPDDELVPLDKPFNDQLEVSVKGIPADGLERILDALQGEVELIEDRSRLLPAPTEVPPVVLFPAPVNRVLAEAVQVLEAWPESKLEGLLEVLEKTAAWKRYRASAGGAVAGQALVRAVGQFLAGPDGREAIRQVRRTSSRDAFWSAADFTEIEGLL